MRKILKYFYTRDIDVFVYRMKTYVEFSIDSFSYTIDKKRVSNNKTEYKVYDNEKEVHTSYLFNKVYLLKLLKKKGPVIGDCSTKVAYRGKSIYPHVINKIAFEVLQNKKQEVFMIVDKENASSIKGIEKSGFHKFAAISAKRWLIFYSKTQIKYF